VGNLEGNLIIGVIGSNPRVSTRRGENHNLMKIKKKLRVFDVYIKYI